MEWVLQVVDEIDDAIGVVRHSWLGIYAQIVGRSGAVLTSRIRARARA
jgi:hypothetical protein